VTVERSVCDECGGPLTGGRRHDLVCMSCGLVHDPPPLPPSPFIVKQRLGSTIARRYSAFTDAGKRPLPSEAQLRFERLKKLQDSTYTGSCFDLFRLGRDLESIVGYLMLPGEVAEMAMRYFTEITGKVRNPYNSYGLLLAACLVAACREMGEGAPVRLEEVVDAFNRKNYRISLRILAKTVSYASNLIPMKKFRRSEEFTSRIICKLRTSRAINSRVQASGVDPSRFFAELEQDSKSLLQRIPPTKRSGKNPFLLAASSIYVASMGLEERYKVSALSKTQFSKEAGIAEYTLRSHLVTVFGVGRQFRAGRPAPVCQIRSQ